jgi:hypothetical protein
VSGCQQQQAMEPMAVAGLFGARDLVLDGDSRHVGIFYV